MKTSGFPITTPTRSLRGALAMLILALAALGPASAAVAQETDAAELDPAELIDAFLTARHWVDQMALPAPEQDEARVELPGVSGVCAVVRHRGRVLGIGTSTLGFRPDLDPDYRGLDLRNAVSRALSDALIDPVVIALSDELRAQLGPRLSLEIEFAATPQPLIGRTYDSFERRLEPGIHGVAMRRDNSWAVRFPVQVALRNRGGQLVRELQALAGDFDLALRSFDEVSRQHGVSAYRFTAVSFFQASPDAAPVELVRGQRLVDASEISAATIPGLTEQWIDHVLKRLWPEEQGKALGIRGDYNPFFDIYDPIVAPPRDQALTAYALLEASRLSALDAGCAMRAQAAGMRILEELAIVMKDPGEEDPAIDELTCALLVIAASRLPEEATPSVELASLLEQSRQNIFTAWSEAAGFQRTIETPLGPDDPKPGFGEPQTRLKRVTMTPTEQAILCAAATELAASGDKLFPLDLVRTIIDGVWRTTPPERAVTLLPWIAQAEYRLIGLNPTAEINTTHLEAMAETGLALDRSRIRRYTPGMRPDLDGAFDLGGNETWGAASIPPAIFMAWRLRTFKFEDPTQRAMALTGHLATMRFLAQLTVSDIESARCKLPGQALGGVSRSCWDANQPLWGQAMAILAGIETIRTFQGD